jgi:RNA polymerase sigma factor (TIGR02999 family)
MMKTKAKKAVRPVHPRKVPPQQQSAAAQMQQVYPEVRRIAARFFQQERSGHTLQATALVHEAFIRLCGGGPKEYVSQAHFFGVVSRAMREILVEHARRRGAKKRGGGWIRVAVEEAEDTPAAEFDLLALDAALQRLNAFDPVLCRITELRYFGGLSIREIATVVRRGQSTIRRDWSIAKAWLRREMGAAGTVSGTPVKDKDTASLVLSA